MSDAEDKTFDPTPRRRQQAREEGRGPFSLDLASAGMLLGTVAILAYSGQSLFEFLCATFRDYLSGEAWISQLGARAESPIDVSGQWNALLPPLARVMLPMLGGGTALALAGNLLQRGLLFRPARIVPDFSRVNPAQGLARLSSGGALARLGLGLAKLLVLAGVAATSIWVRREQLLTLAANDFTQSASVAWQLCLSTCLHLGGALLCLAAVDYALARRRFENELRMTPDEMRQEMRELAGNPQVAARRAALRHGNHGTPAPHTAAASTLEGVGGIRGG